MPAVDARLITADFRLPWAHLPNPPRWRKYLSLLLCALTFPARGDWDLLIGDGPQHLPVVMKSLRLLRRDQKILPYLAGEFAYFLASGYYGPRRTAVLRWWFSQWDAYLCVGEMTADLVRHLTPGTRHRDIFTIQNFLRDERLHELRNVAPSLGTQRMLFIGNGPYGFRLFYKGLDLMLEAFARAKKYLPGLEWSIVGDWDTSVQRSFEAKIAASGGGVSWIGSTQHLRDLLAENALYIHCARGDAWPNTVMEAMVAGVPSLVSEWTGTRDLVAKIDQRLVAPLDPDVIAERIVWYFSLPVSERADLGERGRRIIQTECTEAQAARVFRSTVRSILQHFDLAHLDLSRWPQQTTHESV